MLWSQRRSRGSCRRGLSGSTPNLDVANLCSPRDVDHGYGIVVLVGDIKDRAGGILNEELRVRARWQRIDHLVLAGADHLDRVVVADRDEYVSPVRGKSYAARPLIDLDRLHYFPFVRVDNGDCVALFSLGT